MSDPTRRTKNYLEIKPNENPSTNKIDILKKENKNLLSLLESSKAQLKDCIKNSKLERTKLIDELIQIFESRSLHNDSLTIALNFLKKLKGKPSSKVLTHFKNEQNLYKNKGHLHKREQEKSTDKNFDSKLSNEYFSKNY